MVAREPSGWSYALDHWDHATQAARLAQRIVAGDVGLLEGLRPLHDLLRELGEFDHGDFTGDMAALSYFLLDVEPFLSPDAHAANEQAARWIPTVVAKHRPAALAACSKVVERYQPHPPLRA